MEISSIFDVDDSLLFYIMLFVMVEMPRVVVPFVLKEFTQKLYQRYAILFIFLDKLYYFSASWSLPVTC
jgi:hypothetical protein